MEMEMLAVAVERALQVELDQTEAHGKAVMVVTDLPITLLVRPHLLDNFQAAVTIMLEAVVAQAFQQEHNQLEV
jgi:hypothetical protein